MALLTAVSEAEVSRGFDALIVVLGAKILNNVGYSFVDHLNNYAAVNTAWTNFTGLFGSLWDPLYYTLIFPLQVAGAYSSFNYADFLTIVLFAYVGTTFDPTNVFCKWMFMYIPTFYTVIAFLNNVISEFLFVVNIVQLYNSFESLVYLSVGSILAIITTLVYTFGPLAIAEMTFYPNFF